MTGVRTGFIAAAVAVAVALLAGCGGDVDEPTPAASTPAPAAETPTATATPFQGERPPEPPAGRKVTFRATDGEPVHGRYTPAGRHAPAVVLLHEIRGGVDQWDPLIPYLHDAGLATLAYQSRQSPMEAERLPDAIGAVRWLRARPDVDPRRLALVGASIGASTAVLAMATKARRTVDAAVALSPPDSSDIWALQDDDRYRPHDILFVSDESEAPAADGMMDGAVRSRQMQTTEPGHGVVLLGSPSVRDGLLGWLDVHVR